MNNKGIGELSELEFLLEASKRNFIVSKPYGDNRRYDFITDYKGTIKRVQVKSANKAKDKSRKKKRNQIDTNGGYIDEADIFAIYLIDDKKWYLIPSKRIKAKSCISINSKGESKYNIYIDNWEILKK